MGAGGDRTESLLEVLKSRRVIFVGGKGGVGKTTVAAALALRFADAGRPTLLVSTDSAHSTSDILEATLGDTPREVVPRCAAMEVDPEAETRRFINGVQERIAESVPPRLVEEVERQLELARVSPGALEAAVFERFARLIDGEATEFEHVVFDTAPTAQTLRLLSLPELLSAWIGGLISQRKKVIALGRMWRRVSPSSPAGADFRDPVLAALEVRRDRFHRVRGVVTDSEQAAFAFVVTPERLPVLETERAASALHRNGIPVGAIFVNQLLSDFEDVGLGIRRERQAAHLDRIRRSFRDWPLIGLPLRDVAPVGVGALRDLLRARMPIEVPETR